MQRDIFRLAYDVRMEAGSADAAEVMLYGEIIEDMPDAWKWSQEDKSAADFDKAIKKVRGEGARKLTLRINSPGGLCTEAVAMRGILANAGFDEVNIRIEGLCASAATDIATLPGAHVAITAGSEYMIHNPWCMAAGNADELERAIRRLRNIEAASRGFYMKKTGQDEERVKAWMDAETWFTAEEAVEYGFADELVDAEATGAVAAAACVSRRAMAAMRGLYRNVPETVREEQVSNGTPVAGEPTEIKPKEEEKNDMELNELTIAQLREGNPALYEEVASEAVAAERERVSDIDALTDPGYEEMAEEAKASGMSALDFQKQVVKAKRERGKGFLTSRREETAPAREVAGGAAQDAANEKEEMEAFAKSVAAYATGGANGNMGGMY